MSTYPPVSELAPAVQLAKKQWRDDALSTASGVLLAVFMWGHMLFVSSIWTGERGFDWVADVMEITWIAQLTVVVITVAFFVHFVVASRKIPGKLQERKLLKRLGDDIRDSAWRFTAEQRRQLEKIRSHSETSLWIWQVRTGMAILVIGSIHLFVIATDVLQRTMGSVGITAGESMGRVQSGMWMLYAVLLLCVEVHAGIGLYRVVVKWWLGRPFPVIGPRITRRMAHIFEQLTLWFFIAIGVITLLVLAGVLPPPLAFLLEG
jgi:fumarate reductase subunit C